MPIVRDLGVIVIHGVHHLSRRQAGWLFALVALMAMLSGTGGVGADDVPLAIRGYDPVGYFTDVKALPGRPEFELELQEHRYRFVSTAHRELFKADPARYAPQFSSHCAISLARGEVVEGNPEYWLISEGKLYLFGKPTGPAAFQQALTENVEKARQNAWLIEK
jgi:hypothetical protein